MVDTAPFGYGKRHGRAQLSDRVRAIVIPTTGALFDLWLDESRSSLELLQEHVGGYIEAIGLPSFIKDSEHATAYINEEGKGVLEPNMRATDFMVPGVGLFMGDYIAGNMILCGFDPATGEHRTVPDGVVARARLIEREAG